VRKERLNNTKARNQFSDNIREQKGRREQHKTTDQKCEAKEEHPYLVPHLETAAQQTAKQ
jgi:hypothetical protein